jgi:hypothetical protein
VSWDPFDSSWARFTTTQDGIRHAACVRETPSGLWTEDGGGGVMRRTGWSRRAEETHAALFTVLPTLCTGRRRQKDVASSALYCHTICCASQSAGPIALHVHWKRNREGFATSPGKAGRKWLARLGARDGSDSRHQALFPLSRLFPVAVHLARPPSNARCHRTEIQSREQATDRREH